MKNYYRALSKLFPCEVILILTFMMVAHGGMANINSPSDTVEIPDANFKSGLIDLGVDANGDGEIQLSEAESFTNNIRLLGQDISDLTGLEAFKNVSVLQVQYNRISAADFSSNPNLYEISINGNPLQEVTFGVNQTLTKVRMGDTQVALIDLNGCHKLRHLEATNNAELKTVKVKNGNNHLMYKFDLTGSTNIECIEVDDVTYAETNLADRVPDGATFTEICGEIPPVTLITPTITPSGSTSLPVPESEADKSLNLVASSTFEDPVNYLWYKDGSLLADSTSGSLNLNNTSGEKFDPLFAGSYTAILEDMEGNRSQVSDPVVVTYNEPEPEILSYTPTLSATSSTDLPLPENTADKSLELITDPAPEFVEFNWYKDGVLVLETSSSSYQLNNREGTLFEPTRAGTYRVTAEDIDGNESLFSNEIVVTFTPTGVVNIPDPNFKSALIGLGIDTNGDGEIQFGEAEAVSTELRMLGAGISNLEGIEAFVNITSLKVQGNNLTSVNLSANLLLNEVHIQDNHLNSIDFGKNVELSKIRIQNNELNELDLNELTDLRHLEADNNQLTVLKIKNGNNTRLYKLDLPGNNNLTCIEVDDVSYAESNFINVPAEASFSTDCGGGSTAPDISNLVPTLTASAATDLPLSGTDQTLTLSGESGYPIYLFMLDGDTIQLGSSNTYEVSNSDGSSFDPVTDTGDYTLVVAYGETNKSLTSTPISVTYSETIDPDITDLVPVLNASNSTDFPISGSDQSLTLSGESGYPIYVFMIDGDTVQIGPSNTYEVSNSDGSSFDPATDTGEYVLVVAYDDNNKSLHSDPVKVTFTEPDISGLVPLLSTSATTDFPLPGSDQTLVLSGEEGYPVYVFFLNGDTVQFGASNTYEVSNADGSSFDRVIDIGDYSLIVAYNETNKSLSSEPITVTYTEPDLSSYIPTLSASGSTDLPSPGSDQTLVLSGEEGYSMYLFLLNGDTVQMGASSSYEVSNADGSSFDPSADVGLYTLIVAYSASNQSKASAPVEVTYTEELPSGPGEHFAFGTSIRNGQHAHYYKMVSWDDSQYLEFAYWMEDEFGNISDFMNFRILFPNGYNPNRETAYPMIMMLHGAGESGRKWTGRYTYSPDDPRYDNNGHQLLLGGREHLRAVNRDPAQNNSFEGFVLFPQSSYNASWGPSDREKVFKALEYLINNYHIDQDRISVHGLSNGAKGTWYVAMDRPDLFASMLPMSGTGSGWSTTTNTLYTTPIWLFQGGQDTNPSPGAADFWIGKLEDAGGTPRFTLYPNVGHNVWNLAYGETNFFPFMKAADKKNIHVVNGHITDQCNRSASEPFELAFSSGYLEYQWTRNGEDIGGANGRRITATVPGVYTVKFRRSTDSSRAESYPITVCYSGASSRVAAGPNSNADSKYEISVFPNPFVSGVSVQLKADKLLGEELLIYDQAGRIVKNQKIRDLKTRINLESLRSGIYILQIEKYRLRIIKD